MKIEFQSEELKRLYTERDYYAGFDRAITKAFRKRMQSIVAALDEREFFTERSWRFEKLKGDRDGQYSIRLNDQFRLIIEIEEENSIKTVIIIEIVDYH
jgi:toxin HigB-1